jgi:hypothetical protein
MPDVILFAFLSFIFAFLGVLGALVVATFG